MLKHQRTDRDKEISIFRGIYICTFVPASVGSVEISPKKESKRKVEYWNETLYLYLCSRAAAVGGIENWTNNERSRKSN